MREKKARAGAPSSHLGVIGYAVLPSTKAKAGEEKAVLKAETKNSMLDKLSVRCLWNIQAEMLSEQVQP